MTIDERILLNQLAQGLVDLSEGDRWFAQLSDEKKRAVLREINFMIANAGLRNDDVPNAISKSKLKPTFTPCVVLKSGNVSVQLAKITSLPEAELFKAFRLLVALFGICDSRRREERPLDTLNHWWHRDLNDPKVVAGIKNEFGGNMNDTPGLEPPRIK